MQFPIHAGSIRPHVWFPLYESRRIYIEITKNAPLIASPIVVGRY
jgi:hypothetical protein